MWWLAMICTVERLLDTARSSSGTSCSSQYTLLHAVVLGATGHQEKVWGTHREWDQNPLAPGQQTWVSQSLGHRPNLFAPRDWGEMGTPQVTAHQDIS